jgi:hypothetical protein
VTGTTKSGKTVLTNRVFPRIENIWLDGGAVGSEDDLWNYILDEIDGFTSRTVDNSNETRYGIEGSLEGEGSLPFGAKGKGSVGANYGKSSTEGQSRNLSLSPRSAAISQLRNTKIPLIIDDFHYLDRTFQGNVVRALKPLVFEGCQMPPACLPRVVGRCLPLEVGQCLPPLIGRRLPVNIDRAWPTTMTRGG